MYVCIEEVVGSCMISEVDYIVSLGSSSCLRYGVRNVDAYLYRWSGVKKVVDELYVWNANTEFG